ncbi:MAG: amidohydrolase, partial [Candidatus Aminicenantaceae bacterium]
MRRTPIYLVAFCLLSLAPFLLAIEQPATVQLKKEIREIINKKSDMLFGVSDKIWDYAEIALMEHESSELLEKILESEGFVVEKDVAGRPTAFVATYGSGTPVIGILAEYDALPGLSQESKPFKQVLGEGDAGHGCGHNLFGAGSLGAAIGLKEVMEKHSLKGT